jgi:hypothetical protein
MTRIRGVTGGGYDGNKVGHYNDPKREPISREVSQGAVSRLGGMVGPGTPHKSFYSSTVASNPYGVTDNTKDLGPGGCGRTVMKAGSQSTTPPARSMPKGKPEF